MNIKNAYMCPACKHPNAQAMAIQNLFEDARYDLVRCPECGVEWRVYYRVSEITTEVTYVPPVEEKDSQDLPSEVSPTAESEEVSVTKKSASK